MTLEPPISAEDVERKQLFRCRNDESARMTNATDPNGAFMLDRGDGKLIGAMPDGTNRFGVGD